MRAGFSWLACIALLGGCATMEPAGGGDFSGISGITPALPAIACSDGKSVIDSNFAGSAMAGCQVMGEGHYRLLIRQEDRNVTNCSAWYAFRMQAAQPSDVIVDLDYENCGHRYRPKLWAAQQSEKPCEASRESSRRDLFSRIGRLIARQKIDCFAKSMNAPDEGAIWKPLEPEAYTVENVAEGEVPQARLALKAGPTPQIISSQELVLPADYAVWLDRLESKKAVSRRILGSSLEGRAIELLQIGEDTEARRGQLVLVGRQHPPEVTGALALFAFVERLLEDDELAAGFRSRFTVTVVPLLNPDGVTRGHWRHSRGERDLNRDWGPFTQPETRLMRDLMELMEADPTKDLRFFIDFHSTGRDILYTLDKTLVTDPPGFTEAWIADYQGRLPGYSVVEQPGHNPELPVSKGWGYERFGIPTMTFEIGDETDRELIKQLGRAAAEATMTTMLAHDHAAD